MQGPFHSTTCIAYPDDLKLLSEVFDRICKERGFQRGSFEAEDLGRAAMSLFSAGVFDEAELQESLEEFVKRRSR